MERLQGQIAVVTGAASGIGRATASLFCREGATVAAVDLDGERLHAAVDEVRSRGGRIQAIQADLATSDGPEAAIREAVDAFGAVDILVNCAGGGPKAPVHETSLDEWQQSLDLNLRSVFLCSKFALCGSMLERRKGVIVNVSSINGIRGNHELAAYSAAKGGVVALTYSMALDYAPYGIRVNSVCPGTVNTPMNEQILKSVRDPETTKAGWIAKHPLGYLCEPDQVASAILFLSADDSSYITGLALPVDGGRHIR